MFGSTLPFRCCSLVTLLGRPLSFSQLSKTLAGEPSPRVPGQSAWRWCKPSSALGWSGRLFGRRVTCLVSDDLYEARNPTSETTQRTRSGSVSQRRSAAFAGREDPVGPHRHLALGKLRWIEFCHLRWSND